jgi:hypothetical protein
MATSRYENDIVVRPLHPPLVRVLALIEHRSKPDEQAIAIVRNALLGLRDAAVIAPSKPVSKPASKRASRSAAKPGSRRR